MSGMKSIEKDFSVTICFMDIHYPDDLQSFCQARKKTWQVSIQLHVYNLVKIYKELPQSLTHCSWVPIGNCILWITNRLFEIKPILFERI